MEKENCFFDNLYLNGNEPTEESLVFAKEEEDGSSPLL